MPRRAAQFDRKPVAHAPSATYAPEPFEDLMIGSLARIEDALTQIWALLGRLNRPTIEQRYFKVEEAAVYTGYSIGALEKHIQRGHLPVSKEGTSTRIDKLEIDKWMARNRQ